jgi:hypothetical protein
MVSRRRWSNPILVFAVAILPAFVAHAASAPAIPNPPFTAADFESAATKDMPAMRDKIVAALGPLGARDRATYAEKVANDFTAPASGVNSTRPEVRLNSAILIHDLGTDNTDRYLVTMIQHDDPSVRYWAARSLNDIAPKLSIIGGNTVNRVVNALGNRAKAETSGIIDQEIVKALISYKSFDPLLDALDAVANQMQSAVPDVAQFQTLILGLDFVNANMAAAQNPAKNKAATIASRAASFAAQQQVVAEKVVQASDPNRKLPADYAAAVQRIINVALKVSGTAAGKTYTVKSESDPATILLNISDVFGFPGGKAGSLQTDIKTIPVPPAINTGG